MRLGSFAPQTLTAYPLRDVAIIKLTWFSPLGPVTGGRPIWLISQTSASITRTITSYWLSWTSFQSLCIPNLCLGPKRMGNYRRGRLLGRRRKRSSRATPLPETPEKQMLDLFFNFKKTTTTLCKFLGFSSHNPSWRVHLFIVRKGFLLSV